MAHGGDARTPLDALESAGMRAAVTLHIDAPPDRVWGLVSDITKMGEYSPEVIEAEWIDGATGPAIGARYRGHVKRNENWPVLTGPHARLPSACPARSSSSRSSWATGR